MTTPSTPAARPRKLAVGDKLFRNAPFNPWAKEPAVWNPSEVIIIAVARKWATFEPCRHKDRLDMTTLEIDGWGYDHLYCSESDWIAERDARIADREANDVWAAFHFKVSHSKRRNTVSAATIRQAAELLGIDLT